jgi:hypothetical protein
MLLNVTEATTPQSILFDSPIRKTQDEDDAATSFVGLLNDQSLLFIYCNKTTPINAYSPSL